MVFVRTYLTHVKQNMRKFGGKFTMYEKEKLITSQCRLKGWRYALHTAIFSGFYIRKMG
jgi:hypothetical protein